MTLNARSTQTAGDAESLDLCDVMVQACQIAQQLPGSMFPSAFMQQVTAIT